MATIGIYGVVALTEIAASAYFGYKAITKTNNINTSGPRLTDLSVQTSTYGQPLFQVFGSMRVAGNAIWMQQIKETATTTSTSSGKGGGGTKQSSTNYTYSVTLAIAICQGQIDKISQVWADSELLTSTMLGVAGTDYNIYLGDATQLPDPIIESFEGMGNVPAYRNTAYIVIKDFPLANYGNRVPNFTFEVQRNLITHPNLADKITSIQLIPGAGETVYDTVIEKYVNTVTGVAQSPSNMHNSFNEADVINALDQLQTALPNLTWISLVVCWFATSLDAGSCTIIPKVEFHGDIESSPNAWTVAGLTRSTAEVVMHFPDGTPTYGGTPSDGSVIRLITELKSRGYNIMFYPLAFVDTITPSPKPWRGRIVPANATDAANWFTKTDGYNTFITHYLNLSVGGYALKDHIDAFVIGSEYVGMTSATFVSGVYPAVTGFVNLAATAKGILPGSVKVIYAADWSEYHHAAGGWFNMDPLWSSANIDIVGIDAYFPLTPDLPQSQITYQKVYDGWTKDEGWDYFYDNRPNNTYGTSNLTTNPLTTTNTSNIVALDLTGFFNAHLSVGEAIILAGLTTTGGILAANLNGSRTVHSIVDTTHVTFTAGTSATSGATGGGAAGTIDKPKYFNGFAFAWKNVSYFWSHTHTNPGAGSPTGWTAKMKPIWFTEFGFPSVDACANQPNVFVDPTSSEGNYPRASKHRIDNSAQAIALEASIDFLTAQNSISGNANLIPTRFVWTWDARPYPEYPNLLDVWADGNLWKTGHWIEGKIGNISTVADIVKFLLGEINITAYDVSSITDTVNGYCIPNITDVRSNLVELATPFFFDMVESSGVLKFVKRGQDSVVTIPQDNIVPPASSGDIRTTAQIKRLQEVDLPQKYSATYYNSANNYDQNTQLAQRQTTASVNQVNQNWNLSLDDQTAQNIVGKLLYTAWMNRTTYNFSLPPRYAYIEPTDVITLTLNNVDRVLRVVTTSMTQNGMQQLTAVTENTSTYDYYQVPGNGGSSQQLPTVIPATTLNLLDLPAFPHDAWTDVLMTIAETPAAPNWAGAVLYRSDDGGQSGGNTYLQVTPLTVKSTMGIVPGTLGVGNSYTWDYGNTVTVVMLNGELSSATQLSVLNGANSAVIGGEVIQFMNATLTDTNTYLLDTLLRGRLGTEDQIATHVAGENFTLISGSITRQVMAVSLINVLSYYKCVSIGATLGTTTEQSFTYNARQLKPYSPVDITGTRDVSLNLTINWVRRTRIGGDLRDASEVPLSEQDERYQVDILNLTVVVRTISSTSPTCAYSAAQQIADFGSTQASVLVKIYQISATVGRGIAGIATI